jgi:hypothetical protein
LSSMKLKKRKKKAERLVSRLESAIWHSKY